MSTKPPTRTQDHGGALYAGGVLGNAGGSGAPPSAIRARCRESFLARITVAEQIADNPEALARDRLKALELLGRFALGTGGPASDPNETYPFSILSPRRY